MLPIHYGRTFRDYCEETSTPTHLNLPRGVEVPPESVRYSGAGRLTGTSRGIISFYGTSISNTSAVSAIV